MSTSRPLTQSEKDACVFLSYLFLDTDVCLFADSISDRLRELDIPVSQLEQILRYDVFPVLFPNLFIITGEWGYFDEDWLLAAVEAGRSRSFANPWRWCKGILSTIAWLIIGPCGFWSDWATVKEGILNPRGLK